jgi:hypothetical protein
MVVLDSKVDDLHKYNPREHKRRDDAIKSVHCLIWNTGLSFAECTYFEERYFICVCSLEFSKHRFSLNQN